MVTGIPISEMVMEHTNGKTAMVILENGRIINVVEKG